ERKKGEQRKLGWELDLLEFFQEAPGAAVWSPKGTVLYQVLADRIRRWTRENGYQEIKTPLLYNKALWEKSGHWGKYRENMFLVLDTDTRAHDISLNPMNSPPPP